MQSSLGGDGTGAFKDQAALCCDHQCPGRVAGEGGVGNGHRSLKDEASLRACHHSLSTFTAAAPLAHCSLGLFLVFGVCQPSGVGL
jgi:hypothetical protein